MSIKPLIPPVEVVSHLRNACNGCAPTPCCEFEALGPAAADLIESLQAQLSASQAREKAAVEDATSLRTKLYGTETYDEYYDGLKLKYRVFKVEDGTLVDNCFVLRPDKDYAARDALRRYALKTDNDQISRDIYSWVGETEQQWRGPQAGEVKQDG